MSKVKFKMFGLAIVLVIAISGIVFCFRPLIYRSKEQIHSKLLKDTPLGCDKQFVLGYVKKKGYTLEQTVQSEYESDIWPHRKIGNSYIRVYLGKYQGIPWRCDVTIFWIFDKGEKLFHIDVWKSYDSL